MIEKNGTKKQTKSPSESYCLRIIIMKFFYVMVFDAAAGQECIRYIQNLPV